MAQMVEENVKEAEKRESKWQAAYRAVEQSRQARERGQAVNAEKLTENLKKLTKSAGGRS